MKKMIGAGLAVVALLAVAGCSTTPDTTDPTIKAQRYDRIIQRNVKLDDGTTVTCLTVYGSSGSPTGIDCDWENAK